MGIGWGLTLKVFTLNEIFDLLNELSLLNFINGIWQIRNAEKLVEAEGCQHASNRTELHDTARRLGKININQDALQYARFGRFSWAFASRM